MGVPWEKRGSMKAWIGKKDANLWTSLFLMILSGAVIREAFNLEVGTPNNPGSGFMFFGASSVLGLLALHQFITSLLSKERPAESTPERIHWGRIVSVILAILLYIWCLQPVGYLICTFLLLSLLFQVLQRGYWISRLTGAASTSVVTYVAFAKILQLNLPRGLITFF